MIDIIEMAKVNGSFQQNNKHETRGSKFVPVQPEALRQTLFNHGLNLVSLKTGKARKSDRIAHQTTVSRYRSLEAFQINDLFLDIVVKVPHLYGCIELFLGTYRQVCSNGLVVGTKYESFKVRHQGDAINEVNRVIPMLISQRERMIESIKKMGSIKLTETQLKEFARKAAEHRFEHINTDKIVTVNWNSLLDISRLEDSHTSLWGTLNIIQENILRNGVNYVTINKRGVASNRITRKVNDNTNAAIELNQWLWDTAESMVVHD